MNFSEAVKSAFSKYTQFSGRSSRPEYWYFFLFWFIGDMVAGLLAIPVAVIFFSATLIPRITVNVRRFHDIGMSGWWVLFQFPIAFLAIPYPLVLIGAIPWVYWMCKKGDEGENRFGPYPLASDKKQ